MPREPTPNNNGGTAASVTRARAYASRGWAPVPINPGTRRPRFRGFTQRRLTDAEIVTQFAGAGWNVGAALGALSGGLIDVDLDVPEVVALAPRFLPPTACRWGRDHRPDTHWAYIAAPLPRGRQYADPDPASDQKAMMVELRTKGMAVLPGSTHPSGDSILFASDGEPAHVEAEVIAAAVRDLAIAALLGRHWPAPNSRVRHEAANAAAGLLLRAGLDVHAAAKIITNAARVAHDEEYAQRGADVAATAEARARGSHVTGGPSLTDLLQGNGSKVVYKIETWLDISPTRRGARSESDQLLDLAEGIDLFVEEGGDTGYARIEVNGHVETWPLKSTGFMSWMRHQYFVAHQEGVRQDALTEALNTLEARALFEGDRHVVDVRVGGGDDVIYLDLANDAWEIVEITPNGWRVVADAPVRFRRSQGMLPLPAPVAGGSLDGLLEFINTGGDQDSETLVETFLVQGLRPRGPFMGLEFSGEAGTAKSTSARVLRALLDPNRAPLRAEPRDVRDLMIACHNSFLLALDNVSHLPAWLSDALCRIATCAVRGVVPVVLRKDADHVRIA